MDIADSSTPNFIQNNGNYGILVSRGSVIRVAASFINRNSLAGILVERNLLAEAADNEISGNGDNGITIVEGSAVTFEIGAATVTHLTGRMHQTRTVAMVLHVRLAGMFRRAAAQPVDRDSPQ